MPAECGKTSASEVGRGHGQDTLQGRHHIPDRASFRAGLNLAPIRTRGKLNVLLGCNSEYVGFQLQAPRTTKFRKHVLQQSL